MKKDVTLLNELDKYIKIRQEKPKGLNKFFINENDKKDVKDESK